MTCHCLCVVMCLLFIILLVIKEQLHFDLLTSSSSFALADRLHDTDATAGLQRRLEPVRRVVNIGHVDPQASVLTEKNHGGTLLLITGRVTDSYHILNLWEKRKLINVNLKKEQ